MLTSWDLKGKRLSITIETYLGVWIVCLTDQEQLKLNQPMQNGVVSKLRDQFLCHKGLLNKSVSRFMFLPNALVVL